MYLPCPSTFTGKPAELSISLPFLTPSFPIILLKPSLPSQPWVFTCVFIHLTCLVSSKRSKPTCFVGIVWLQYGRYCDQPHRSPSKLEDLQSQLLGVLATNKPQLSAPFITSSAKKELLQPRSPSSWSSPHTMIGWI